MVVQEQYVWGVSLTEGALEKDALIFPLFLNVWYVKVREWAKNSVLEREHTRRS